MEYLRIRSLFGCVFIFTASLVLFFIIFITCQHQHLTRSLVSSVAKHQAQNDDLQVPQFTRTRLKVSKDQENQENLPKRPSLNQAFRVAKSRMQELKHSAFFGVRQAFPFSKSGIERAFEADRQAELSFQQAVQRLVGNDRILFLASVDTAYVTMAFNLYLTSFLPLNISNYLFVGTDERACSLLRSEHPVTCVRYFTDRDGNRSSNWGSANFRRKTHYKTKIVLETLKLGVTAIIVDLDIVLFKNPIPYMGCSTCDIQIQSDVSEGNSGFYMAHPTKGAIELHEKALTIGAHNPMLSNQKTLGRTIDWMSRHKRIRVRTLNRKLFPCGTRYFEERRIMFVGDNTCSECVIVHNNWIVSQEAKIYRFRETGLWQVDTGNYYSDSYRKYLAYDNPVDFGQKITLRQETDALRAALVIGFLLNRTVILPEFHCHGCKYGACKNTRGRCALNTFYKIADFDRNFGGRYREHVFLSHHLVPEVVKRSLSHKVLIETNSTSALVLDARGATETFSPANATFSALELMSWFAEGVLAEFSVLRFHSLYGVFQELDSIISTSASSNDVDSCCSMVRLSRAFRPTDYRQY